MDSSLEEAIRYISSELKENPGADKSRLIEEACQKFDLDPMKSEFLVAKFFKDE